MVSIELENLNEKKHAGALTMTEHNCESCNFKKKYDDNPKSILGKIWRWHAGWCPGWKAYITSLPDEKRIELAEKYNLKKYIA